MMALGPARRAVRPPIFRTIATSGEGIAALRDGLVALRRRRRERTRRAKRRWERAEMRFLGVLTGSVLARRARDAACRAARFAQIVSEIAERRLDPYTAADRVLPGGNER